MTAHAQDGAHVGAAVGVVADVQAKDAVQVGGATWSGTVYAGRHVSPRLSLEVDASFGGALGAETYTYRPTLSQVAEVESHGRYTFLTAQIRGKAGVVEPVAGVSYVHSTFSRHAVYVPGNRVYFDDDRSENALALTGGVDFAFAVSRRVAVVPTIRLFFIQRPDPPTFGNSMSGGPVVVRAGVGLRKSF